VTISVRLDPGVEERLTHLAEYTGRPKAFYIKEAITSTMDRLEYEYGILRDAELYRAGKLETYSLDEVGEMLDLDR
jgi:RHH-type rel operon transcriptional repressor/antitoxin RelB